MLIEIIIDEKNDNPMILRDKVYLISKKVFVKFDSRVHAEDLLRSHANKDALSFQI